MKIESQPRDDHQVKLIVEFEDEIVQAAMQKAARNIARRVKVPGFRPGKAPYAVILRQVGEPAVLENAIEILVDEQYPNIIEQAEIRPYTSGQLEKIANTSPLTLEFIVPLEPEIILGDYQSIRRSYSPKEITENDIDDFIEDVRGQQAVVEPVERPALEGDVVNVFIKGTRTKPAEGEDASLLQERVYEILVRKNMNSEEDAKDEWPFPGFSRSLIGLQAGDEKSITHTFADDYEFEAMRGVEARYDIKVEGVKERVLPDLDENFLATFGEYENFDMLRAEVRARLEDQAQQTYDENYNNEVISQLIEQSTIKFPPQMLESEQNDILYNFKRRIEQQGMEFDLYLKARQIDLEKFKEEVRPVAEERIKRSLVLLELAKIEDIQVNEEDLQHEATHTLSMLNQSLSPDDARRLTDARVMNNLVGNLMLEMLTQRATKRLREITSEGATSAIDQVEEIAEEETEIEETEITAADESGIATEEPQNSEIAEVEAEFQEEESGS